MFTNEDIRPAMRHLKQGGFLWYAPDQDMRGKDTVFASAGDVVNVDCEDVRR